MTTLTEGDLQITLPRGTKIRKFDDPGSHELTHCMKAVDFVVELGDRVLFIEIKDPEHPRAPIANRKRFIQDFRSERLDDDLVRKYRDSFLYKWACNKTGKPIHYWIIVAIESLTDADLLGRNDDLKRKLPAREAAPASWERQIAEDCRVFNIRSWNEALPDGYEISRIRE